MQANADNSITVDGALEYVELAPQLGLPPQSDDAEFHTVAGLVMEKLGELPEIGDGIDFHGWHFEVIEKDGHRIERIKITRLLDDE